MTTETALDHAALAQRFAEQEAAGMVAMGELSIKIAHTEHDLAKLEAWLLLGDLPGKNADERRAHLLLQLENNPDAQELRTALERTKSERRQTEADLTFARRMFWVHLAQLQANGHLDLARNDMARSWD